ncbi:MAG: glycosyltransferase [Oscillospiraceae bacterium]|nr:glycosyltransferase [Oscillospiraceae bacterium]
MCIVSIIITYLNEEECISDLCNFIDAYAIGKPYNLEVIFVDDGSTDNTTEKVTAYKFVNCKVVKLIKFSKNFGMHAAIRAGYQHATGDYCTYIGADLQEPADMIDVMYENIIKGYDAVYIEKNSIDAGVINNMFSRTFAFFIRKYAVKNYGSGGTNNIMINRKVLKYMNENIEINSGLALQLINAGFRSTSVKMDYKKRIAGTTKWSFSNKLKLFIDSFVSFSSMPIRAVSSIGIIMALLGFIYGAYIIINRLINPDVPMTGFATLASLILFSFGITNISLGIIAEYLWRTYDAARGRPAFILSDVQILKDDNTK